MLPINVQESTDMLTTLLPMMLCCMLPTLFRQPSQAAQEASESDFWYVGDGTKEAYDTIVKEVDGWRENAEEKRSKGMFSSLRRKKQTSFGVDQAIPPRLYRVKDPERGEISFELTEVDEGGTSIKSTYDSRARVLIQNFKAKMPVKIPASTAPKVCPSCGKTMMPEFKTCPFCGTKLR